MMHTGRTHFGAEQTKWKLIVICLGLLRDGRRATGKIGCLTIWRVCPDSAKLLSCANSLDKLKLLYNFQLTSVNYFESNLKLTFIRVAETSDITMFILKNINITIEIMCRCCRV